MATEGRLNFLEGWNKWQIALAVGAPVALGLAGIWFYKRSKKQSPKSPADEEVKVATSTQVSPEKKTEVGYFISCQEPTFDVVICFHMYSTVNTSTVSLSLSLPMLSQIIFPSNFVCFEKDRKCSVQHQFGTPL